MSTSKTILQNAAPDFAHYDKFVEPDENISFENTILKWYNLAKPGEPVSNEVGDLARDFLEREFKGGNLNNFGKLGFVILHRCGDDFYFLLANSWKNGNELWESVYAKSDSEQEDFQPFSFENSIHCGTFCIWELAAVWHEQRAWKHFLLSAKIGKDESDYLQSKYRGEA